MSFEPSFPYSSVAVAAQREPVARALSKCMAMGVLSLVDPEAGATDDLKAATATMATPVVWTAADLEAAGLVKLSAHGSRALTFTTGGVTPSDAPASVTITGKDRDGAPLTETVLLSQVAGTVPSLKCFSGDEPTLSFPSADGVGATIAVGIADKFGLPCKIKSRGGYPVRFVELADGDIVSTGGASATAVNQAETATNQAETATNQATTIVRHEPFAGVVAPATALGTIDEGAASASASTQPGHPQTLDVAFDAGWEGGDITITGVGPNGLAVNETYIANPGATVTGAKAFLSIDANGIVNSAPTSTGDAATVQTGTGIGIAAEGTSVFLKLTVNGVAEAFSATDTTNRTFDPTTAPDGTKFYEVWYSVDHNHLQDAHNHLQDAHNHTQNAHSHSGSEATVASVTASPPYGAYTPTTVPDGSVDFVLVFEQDPQV